MVIKFFNGKRHYELIISNKLIDWDIQEKEHKIERRKKSGIQHL
ncbi:hypothetical protein [Porphyromonas pogonae]